jgi:glycerol kinase
VWGSLDELSELWHLDTRFEPGSTQGAANMKHTAWLRAVERSRGWA